MQNLQYEVEILKKIYRKKQHNDWFFTSTEGGFADSPHTNQYDGVAVCVRLCA